MEILNCNLVQVNINSAQKLVIAGKMERREEDSN